MKKYGIKGKAKQATQLILTCIIAAVCIWFVCGICSRFLRSPSSGAGMAPSVVPVLFDDPNDIMYWPSIDELQWFAETKRDGLFRKISQDDYEAQRWIWYCDMSARETWPQELIVKEIQK